MRRGAEDKKAMERVGDCIFLREIDVCGSKTERRDTYGSGLAMRKFVGSVRKLY